jgi:endogenous inhibitor of DNA gyrase (YacG/DUF329 family)
MDQAPKDPAAPRARRCPICGKPAVPQFRAFCSRRCADIDLNRWLSGVYAVPGKPEEAEDGQDASEAKKPDESDDEA